MDIFEIAQQGMDLEQKEIEEKRAEEEAQAQKKKSYKFDIRTAMDAAAQKDYGWYGRLSDEDKKNFSPHMLNLWMKQIWPRNSSRAFVGNDPFYATIVCKINEHVNRNCYEDKRMVWLLACMVQEQINFKYDKKGNKHVTEYLKYTTDWVKAEKRQSEKKYDKRVIKYMANELRCSEEKIYDLIESNLITDQMMKEIAKDLDTLEDQSKKKRKK